MTAPTVVQRIAFGRERRITVGAERIERRGGTRDKDIRFTDVHRLRLSRTWMGFNRSHLRWTIYGAGQRLTVSLTTDSSSPADTVAFGCFIESCLDHVISVRPDVVVVIGMSWAWWLVWLATFGLALVGLVAAAAMMIDDGSLLVQGPPVLALLAGLLPCWRNLHEGWSKRVSGGEARVVIAQFDLGTPIRID